MLNISFTSLICIYTYSNLPHGNLCVYTMQWFCKRHSFHPCSLTVLWFTIQFMLKMSSNIKMLMKNVNGRRFLSTIFRIFNDFFFFSSYTLFVPCDQTLQIQSEIKYSRRYNWNKKVRHVWCRCNNRITDKKAPNKSIRLLLGIHGRLYTHTHTLIIQFEWLWPKYT